MIGKAWLLDGYDDWYKEMAGFMTGGISGGDVVTVMYETADKRSYVVKAQLSYEGAIIPRQFIEFIPPHLSVIQNSAGKWIAIEPNLDFVESYEDYHGLILTTPLGKEIIIDDKFMPNVPHMQVARFSADNGKASLIAKSHGFEIIESPRIDAVMIWIYTESDS